MASTFKIAVAGAILSKIDKGQLSLKQLVPVDYAMMVESEGLAATFHHPGVSVSVDNLLELMLTVSDNTRDRCADQACRRAGRGDGLGAGAGDRRAPGRPRHGGADPRFLPYRVPARFRTRSPPPSRPIRSSRTKGDKPTSEFDNDPRDTATPVAMARLLERIFGGKAALTPASTRLLIEIMERNTTGKAHVAAAFRKAPWWPRKPGRSAARSTTSA